MEAPTSSSSNIADCPLTPPSRKLFLLIRFIYDRIQKDTKNQRPLFLNHSKEDFKAIYDGRMALYQDLADLVVTVDNRTPEEVARFIKCM